MDVIAWVGLPFASLINNYAIIALPLARQSFSLVRLGSERNRHMLPVRGRSRLSVVDSAVESSMISTRDLSLLPDVDDLRCTLQSMAILDAVLCPEWQFRCYSFNAAWCPGEQLGSMRNGSGDNFFAHFSPAGCWLKGFAQEYPMSLFRTKPNLVWLGVLEAVPAEFAACLREPAFSVGIVTFCIWRRYSDQSWQIGPIDFPVGHADPDGSGFLLSNLDGRPETYWDWAKEYYEREVSLAAVEHVYQHWPLTPEIVGQLNPDLSPADLIADVKQIGYPG